MQLIILKNILDEEITDKDIDSIGVLLDKTQEGFYQNAGGLGTQRKFQHTEKEYNQSFPVHEKSKDF